MDPDGKAGLASFASGLLKKGAGDLDEEAFEARLDDLSIGISHSVSRDAFFGSLQTLTNTRDEAFAMVALALTQARFDEGPLERRRARLMAALERQETSAGAQANLAFWRAAFPDHPYGNPIRGTMESVPTFTSDDLHAFVENRFARDNLIVGVVGDIDAETLSALLDKTFGDLPQSPAVAVVADVVPKLAPGMQVIEIDQPQSTVMFGHSGVKITDPDWYAISILEYLVGGGGLNSFLGQEVREKRGLAYSMSTQLRPLKHAGLFLGGGGTQNARVGETIAVVEAELVRVRENGVTEEQVRDAITYVTGSYLLNFDTSGKMSGNLVTIQRLGLGIDHVSKRNDKVRAVTTDDVNRVARTFLQPDQLHWVIAGKPEGLDEDRVVGRTIVE